MPKPGSRVFPSLPAIALKPLGIGAFALSVATTVTALLLRLALGYLDPQIPPYATFFASVLITTILAGVGAGLFAAALGLAAAFWIIGSIQFGTIGWTSAALYLISAAIIVWVAEQYRIVLRNLQQREAATEQQLTLIAAERDILERVVRGSPLTETLTQLTRIAEEYSRGEMFASILLMDEDRLHLRHGAAPSLPSAYNEAIDGVAIGPSVGSCGTAAFRKTPVYVTDIQTDPLWADYRELAQQHKLAACWSIPILDSNKNVLGTFALYHHNPRTPSRAEKDIVELLASIAAIAIEHDRSEKGRQLLIDELAHRVRNTLTVILSIANSTIRSKTDPVTFKAFEDRLIALSSAQRLITDVKWSSVSISDLIYQVAVTPFATGEERFEIAGPQINFPPRLVLPFALSLHELCTNATKYGALSCKEGRVKISWGHTEDSGDRKFFFRWSEIGGPPVAPPAKHGFGSRVVKSMLTSEFGGRTTVDYQTEGVVFEVLLPKEHFSVDDEARVLKH